MYCGLDGLWGILAAQTIDLIRDDVDRELVEISVLEILAQLLIQYALIAVDTRRRQHIRAFIDILLTGITNGLLVVF